MGSAPIPPAPPRPRSWLRHSRLDRQPLTSFALSGTAGLVQDTNGDGSPDITWVQVSPGLIEAHLGGASGELVARITLQRACRRDRGL